MQKNEVTADVSSAVPLKEVHLHFTTDSGLLVERKWQSHDASLNGKTISASIPAEANIWMLSATDSRNALVTTPVVFREAAK